MVAVVVIGCARGFITGIYTLTDHDDVVYIFSCKFLAYASTFRDKSGEYELWKCCRELRYCSTDLLRLQNTPGPDDKIAASS